MGINEYDPETGRETVKTVTKTTDKPKHTEEEVRALKLAALNRRWRDKTKCCTATIELVKEACADGCTIGNICAVLGISVWQFRHWKDTIPAFAEAVQGGRMIEHDRLVNRLVEMALKGNVACLIFALKSRHNYNDSGTGTAVIENRVQVIFQLPDAMKPEQYLKTLAATAEVIKPDDVTRALAKPGVRGKVLKQLSMERKEMADAGKE